MSRSNTQFQQYLSEIKHEANIVDKKKDFPADLLTQWIHKDICLACLKLDGVINQLYRATASIALESCAGAYEADASHSSESTTVSGFTGLTPDAWINGSILVVKSDVFYSAQITDNDATTITISAGGDLPVLSDDPVILTANNGGSYADISSLSMINFAEPIWQVLDPDGAVIPPAPPGFGKSMIDDYYSNNEKTWRVQGQTIQFDLGSSASMSGSITAGYYILPVQATANTDYIDFPIEYQEIPKQMTIIRALRKKGMIGEADRKESEVDSRVSQLLERTMSTQQIDKMTGERGQ